MSVRSYAPRLAVLVVAFVGWLVLAAPGGGTPESGYSSFIPAREAHAQSANRAGLVVMHGDGSVVARCVAFSEPTISGIDLLQRSGLPFTSDSGSIGSAVCSIDSEGCAFPGESCFCKCQGGAECDYWSYWQQAAGWQYSPSGAAGSVIQPESVWGWQWGVAQGQPATLPVRSIAEICAVAATATPSPTASTTSSPTPSSTPGNTSTPTSTPSPTASATETATPLPSASATPLGAPQPTGGQAPGTIWLPSVAAQQAQNTAADAAALQPTATQTVVPATAAPATAVSVATINTPTIPPTDIPATQVPATQVPATQVPGTAYPTAERPVPPSPGVALPATYSAGATDLPTTETAVPSATGAAPPTPSPTVPSPTVPPPTAAPPTVPPPTVPPSPGEPLIGVANAPAPGAQLPPARRTIDSGLALLLMAGSGLAASTLTLLGVGLVWLLIRAGRDDGVG